MFVHEPQTDTYRCPAGQQLQKRFAREEGGKHQRVLQPEGLWCLRIAPLVHGRQGEAHPTMGT
jgi:hypothetical protein